MLGNLKSHPGQLRDATAVVRQLSGKNFAYKNRLEPPPRLERGLTDYKSVRLPLADRGIFR